MLQAVLFTLLFIRRFPHAPRIDACVAVTTAVTVEVDHASLFSQRYLAHASLAPVSHLGARLEAVALLIAEFRRVPSFVASSGSAPPSSYLFGHNALMSYLRRDTSSHVRRFTLASTILRRNLRTLFLVSFQNHRHGFYSRRLGVFPFQNFTTGVLKPPPRGFRTTDRLSTTPTGVFSNTDLFFSRGFTTSAPNFVPSVGVSVGVFLLPAAFCFRTPTGFFTRLLFLFLHIVRELLPFISL